VREKGLCLRGLCSVPIPCMGFARALDDEFENGEPNYIDIVGGKFG
jgi:hypothetical protein